MSKFYPHFDTQCSGDGSSTATLYAECLPSLDATITIVPKNLMGLYGKEEDRIYRLTERSHHCRDLLYNPGYPGLIPSSLGNLQHLWML